MMIEHEQTQPFNEVRAQRPRAIGTLFNSHPIADESEQLRLQYLAALAQGLAIGRQPTGAQCLEFHNLVLSLGSDETVANELLNKRAATTEQEKNSLFDMVREKNLSWAYRLDLAWLQTADGGARDADDTDMWRISKMVDRGARLALDDVHKFVLLIRDQNQYQIIKEMELMFSMSPDEHEYIPLVASAANLQRHEIIVNLPTKLQKHIPRIEWLLKVGQAINERVDVAVASGGKNDSLAEQVFSLVLSKLTGEESAAQDIEDFCYESIASPCCGILAGVYVAEGGRVRHNQSVGLVYGYAAV